MTAAFALGGIRKFTKFRALATPDYHGLSRERIYHGLAVIVLLHQLPHALVATTRVIAEVVITPIAHVASPGASFLPESLAPAC